MEVQSVVVTQHCAHSELIPSLSSAPGIHNTFSAADKAACLCAMAVGSAEETRGEKTAVALLAVQHWKQNWTQGHGLMGTVTDVVVSHPFPQYLSSL